MICNTFCVSETVIRFALGRVYSTAFVRFRMARFWCWISLLLLVSLGQAQAQSSGGKAPWEEFERRIKASQKVAPLGNNAFGDQVSLSNGALSFAVEDVSIPGNSGLPVAFGRQYATRNWRYRKTDLMLADWDVQLPNISGVFAKDWVDGSGGTARCSSMTAPEAPSGGYTARDFWDGNQLEIPGVGGGELLVTESGTTKPTTGGPWRWVVNGKIHISCLSSIKNGTGEGFLAITPDGTRYWFDWMAQYYEPELRRPITIQGLHGEIPTPRRRNVLYATRVEDRFGNWVTYTYSNAWNQPGKLTAISSSDGRNLSISYNSNGHVSSVTDGSRTWAYSYGAAAEGRRTLTGVTLPDSSAWAINLAAFTSAEIKYTESFQFGEIYRTCYMLETPLNYDHEPVGTITHPAGVTGTFTLSIQEHGRSQVTLNCGNYSTPSNDPNDDVNLYAISYHAYSLKSKTVSGPGLTPATWNYSYSSGTSIYRYPGTTLIKPICTPWNSSMGVPYYNCYDPPCQSEACAGSSVTTVVGPNGEWQRHYYGNTFRYDEGKLRKVEVGSGTPGSNILRTTTYTYDLSMADQAYPAKFGDSLRPNHDGFANEWHRPQTSRTIVQQGVSFNWMVDTFDALARPTREIRSSSLGTSRTDQTSYYDNKSLWVMGQVAWTRNLDSGIYTSKTEYDASTALPVRLYTPGATSSGHQLVQTLAYNADGTLATIKDGLNQVTEVKNWYRGLPRRIDFPDGTNLQATVNTHGFITSVTNERGFKTNYQYDALGRLTQLSPPTGDTVEWEPTNFSFVKVASSEYGIPAGHWRLTESRGDYRRITYFDGLWRPVIEREYDNANASGTQRFRGWRYDAEGRVAFEGYPRSTASNIASFTQGVTTTYDALGRVTQTSQDSELGALVTTTAYLSGFKTRVTNPRGYKTLTEYLVWDEPSTDWPVKIVQAEGQAVQQTTEIARNALGNPTGLTRSGTYGGGAQSVARQYVYDAQQRLCKQIEPETGAALFAYDAAGNLAWSAEGTNLTTLSCNRGSVAAADKVLHSYDARNRLILVDYPDSTPDVSTSYHPDGAVRKVISGDVTLTYGYNRLGLLTSERLQYGSLNWLTQYGYTPLGHLATLTYRDGHQVSYAPNALGQPTQAGTYATGVTYHPNGAIKQFTYGNGIVHTLTQNARGLPERSRDALGATVVLDDSYDYDKNGNVLAISDGLTGQPGNRDMSYDALDRLLSVTAGSAQGGNGTFAYDALDNIRRLAQGSRDYRMEYDAANRNHQVRNDAGATVFTQAYDTRGNLVQRQWAGGPTDTFTFDRANRLTASTVGGLSSTYVYDGLGRRVREVTGGSTYFQYSQDGKLLYTNDVKTQLRHNHIYLGGSLVAMRTVSFDGATSYIRYQHTDALGSPVAETDESGQVVRRERLTAWGEPADGTWSNGPGFTGHRMDAASKLVYMQQRYYDPAIGRFLSVDPVTELSSGDMRHFTRYTYAYDNPYKFTDPDGRAPPGCGDGTCYQKPAISHSPVPSSTKLNEADKPREGRGEFGTPRNTSSGASTHSGIDIEAPAGSPVVAVGSGKVVDIQPNPSGTYGNQVVIQHNGRLYTQSAHLETVTVKPGQFVDAGQQIGTVGRTGNTPAAGDSHLHFEVRIGGPNPRANGGTVVDPSPLLPLQCYRDE